MVMISNLYRLLVIGISNAKEFVEYHESELNNDD